MTKYKYLPCERETIIRYADDEKMATVETFNRKYVQYLSKLFSNYPEDVRMARLQANADSIVVFVPKKWIKIIPPRKISEAQRIVLRNRMSKMNSMASKSHEVP